MATGKNVHKILLCFPHDIALNCGGTKKAVPNITSLSAIRKANVLFVLVNFWGAMLKYIPSAI